MILPAAKHYTLDTSEPRLAAGASAQSVGTRTLAELQPVTALPIDPASGETIQYWTFSDVSWEHDRDQLARLPLSYDLTVLAATPVGWECTKTHGHAHTAHDSGEALPEIYEVLEGQAGFLVQDLQDGPRATFVALIEAGPGELVAIPPRLQHCTLNLGTSPLVVADIVARAVHEDYTPLRAARGMAYFIRTDGDAVSNPTYASAPSLNRLRAATWSSWAVQSGLYQLLVTEPAALGWLTAGSAARPNFPHLPDGM